MTFINLDELNSEEPITQRRDLEQTNQSKKCMMVQLKRQESWEYMTVSETEHF